MNRARSPIFPLFAVPHLSKSIASVDGERMTATHTVRAEILTLRTGFKDGPVWVSSCLIFSASSGGVEEAWTVGVQLCRMAVGYT
jgi:hypothetical protein